MATAPNDPFASLEAAAAAHERSFSGPPIAQPRLDLAVVTCMDVRVDPLAIFALEVGDAHIMRNAGARASEDLLRSLIISSVRFRIDKIAVVHHTDCGAASITDLDMHDHVLARTGASPAGMEFLFFKDQAQAIRADVDRITHCPYLPAGVAVAGYLYDVASAHLERSTPTEVIRPHDAHQFAPAPGEQGAHESHGDHGERDGWDGGARSA